MFSSTILDVAAGIVFTFLALSLATGAIVEAVASLLRLRSGTLVAGVKQLVNDPRFEGLAKDLYSHGLVNPRGPGASDPLRNRPTYIEPAHFAAAFMDILGVSNVAATAPTAAGTVDTMKRSVDIKLREVAGRGVAGVPAVPDQQLSTFLHGVIDRALGDPTKIRAEVAEWFDSAMDRLSGSYKRMTQVVTLAVALAISVVAGLDSIRVGDTLWAEPTLADKLKVDQQTPIAAFQALETAIPVGWPDGQILHRIGADGKVEWLNLEKWQDWQTLFGCGITALATLFGAPFWFDALQRITRLKGTGPSPGEKEAARIRGVEAL